MSRVFIDTNVLAYSVDDRDLRKRERARAVLSGQSRNSEGRLVVSTQVLQEFFVAATRKIGVDAHVAGDMVAVLIQSFDVEVVTPSTITAAIACSQRNRLSFWDALVITAAAMSGCQELWSEDLNASQVIDGIRVVNPFEC